MGDGNRLTLVFKIIIAAHCPSPGLYFTLPAIKFVCQMILYNHTKREEYAASIASPVMDFNALTHLMIRASFSPGKSGTNQVNDPSLI